MNSLTQTLNLCVSCSRLHSLHAGLQVRDMLDSEITIMGSVILRDVDDIHHSA